MNVYDFDNTIYDGDSTIDFYIFCLKRYPQIILKLPKQIRSALYYKLGKVSKTLFKQDFFCFLCEIPEINKTVGEFWDINQHKIKGWYKDQQKRDDLIISASPEFLLRNVCDRLDIKNLIASQVDEKTGKFLTLNCHGEEKIIRYKAAFGSVKIDKFYSDSLTDMPMAKLSHQPFLVKKNQIVKW